MIPFLTVAEDLEWLRDEWWLGSPDTLSDSHIRRGSAAIGALLNDGFVSDAWRHYCFEGEPRICGPDIVAIAAREGLRIDLAPAVIAGGGRDATLEIAMFGTWRVDNGRTGVRADAEKGFELRLSRIDRDPNALITENELLLRQWTLSDYLTAPGIVRRGIIVSRRDVINYFRDFLGSNQRAGQDFGSRSPAGDHRPFDVIDELAGKVPLDDRDGLHFELLSIGQAVGASSDLRALAYRIREGERAFRRKSPPKVLQETQKDSNGTVMTLGGLADARTDPDAQLLENFIRLRSLNTPIYRTFTLPRFRELLREGAMALVTPSSWEDPFEDLVSKCFVSPRGTPGGQISLGALRKPVFGQCWSLTADSDAMWRIYSVVRKDGPFGRNLETEREGVRVRTTLRRLLRALWTGVTERPEESCFLGAVRYMPAREALQDVVTEIAKARESAFGSGRDHAESLLVKRREFAHEREVRLLHVDMSAHPNKSPVLKLRIDPSELFSRVTLDPRLSEAEFRDREAELRALGYESEVTVSKLYERTAYEFVM